MILELQLEGNCHSLGLKTFKRKKESVSQLRQILVVFRALCSFKKKAISREVFCQWLQYLILNNSFNHFY